MKENLKEILAQIVADLREQGHDPLERPIVFMWHYDDGEDLKYTLVIQKKEDDDEDKPVSH